MERLVPHAAQPRRAGQGRLAGGAADPRGALQHGGCAGLRRLLHLAAEPRRPRQGGLPRPARQRDRADHDRDRRPGLAADDLLSFAAFQPPGRGRVLRTEIDSPTYAARYNDPQGPINDYYDIPGGALPQALPPCTTTRRARAHPVRAEPQPRRGAASQAGRGRIRHVSPSSRRCNSVRIPTSKPINTRTIPDRIAPKPLAAVRAARGGKLEATLAPCVVERDPAVFKLNPHVGHDGGLLHGHIAC